MKFTRPGAVALVASAIAVTAALACGSGSEPGGGGVADGMDGGVALADAATADAEVPMVDSGVPLNPIVTVIVKDVNGVPVSGTSVQFTPAGAAPVIVATDAAGVATAAMPKGGSVACAPDHTWTSAGAVMPGDSVTMMPLPPITLVPVGLMASVIEAPPTLDAGSLAYGMDPIGDYGASYQKGGSWMTEVHATALDDAGLARPMAVALDPNTLVQLAYAPHAPVPLVDGGSVDFHAGDWTPTTPGSFTTNGALPGAILAKMDSIYVQVYTPTDTGKEAFFVSAQVDDAGAPPALPYALGPASLSPATETMLSALASGPNLLATRQVGRRPRATAMSVDLSLQLGFVDAASATQLSSGVEVHWSGSPLPVDAIGSVYMTCDSVLWNAVFPVPAGNTSAVLDALPTPAGACIVNRFELAVSPQVPYSLARTTPLVALYPLQLRALPPLSSVFDLRYAEVICGTAKGC